MNNFPAMTEEQRHKMISDCQAEIVEIEKALTTWGEGWISYLQSKLTRQKIALSALTAKPAGKFYAGPRGKVSIHPSESLPLGFNPFYTAPPAPVLRVPDGWALVPVEPTEDMLAAAKEWFGLTTTAEGVYEKMLAAAPEDSNEQ